MADGKSYAIVTMAYWGFTITDGALRMLVLLNFHAMGYQPLELAFLFLLYEAMGIMTNFVGGWIGARFGLRLTLYMGLALQIAALTMLAFLPESLNMASAVIYIMITQAMSGCAKDLTKMSSKSAVKLVVPEGGDSLLFKWVSLLTGSKNALKGFGFFVGGFLLTVTGFFYALIIMAVVLLMILVLCICCLTQELGKSKVKIKKRELVFKSRPINLLSAARIFLFASRDVWFVVGLPVFLSSVAGWSFDQTGGFMAIWVIGYGIIQALVPKFLKNTNDSVTAISSAANWGWILVLITILIMFVGDNVALMLAGLMVFGVVFAFNSSLHSYLIVALSDHEKVSLNVGFYYMANAIGRFLGTLLSGLVYQYYGLEACLAVSSGMILMSVLLVRRINNE
ncbi:organoarsenical effux MFS transporter ArsJ [Pseudemcibacter aquimaris]|uniref:organoarsenical effux MFS transporter ArsJ n=1 Tax=Pseudemcibacter aquimaris TaxID=2857064 RepID=UPI00201272B0|nr:organoarsenical effux MFS transporter ArsJ [Pseudemcibacter aquimaris]MCC3862496.1 organoarsenical effux MFS transporter ArsJ [Pseudemcibacter aquimaris]WDU57758.1 organoarsenical effux MFS transporter ArsJ [Pseudemcibacter aquimaris]